MDFGTITSGVTLSELAGMVLGERGTECFRKRLFCTDSKFTDSKFECIKELYPATLRHRQQR
jgi:hypothetical protein